MGWGACGCGVMGSERASCITTAIRTICIFPEGNQLTTLAAGDHPSTPVEVAVSHHKCKHLNK